MPQKLNAVELVSVLGKIKLCEFSHGAGILDEVIGCLVNKNGMNYKKVMRYLRLNSLVPELLDKVDDKKMGFMPAVELPLIALATFRGLSITPAGMWAGWEPRGSITSVRRSVLPNPVIWCSSKAPMTRRA